MIFPHQNASLHHERCAFQAALSGLVNLVSKPTCRAFQENLLNSPLRQCIFLTRRVCIDQTLSTSFELPSCLLASGCAEQLLAAYFKTNLTCVLLRLFSGFKPLQPREQFQPPDVEGAHAPLPLINGQYKRRPSEHRIEPDSGLGRNTDLLFRSLSGRIPRVAGAPTG